MREVMSRAHADLAAGIRAVEAHGGEFDPSQHMPTALRRIDVGVPADALSGSGINASITDEEAYLELLAEFAEDKEIAARLAKKRAAKQAEEAAAGGSVGLRGPAP